MVDKVKPLKIESPSTGGTQDDMFPTETNPSQDYVAAKGIAFEGSDTRLVGTDGSGNIEFQDVIQTSPFRLNKLVKDFGTVANSLLASTQATAASTKTLTLSSNTIQIFTGTTVGQIVKLPVATTLAIGHHFYFINKSNQNISVQTQNGVLLFTIGLTSVAELYLDNASTANGTWTYYQSFISGTATGIQNYVVASGTNFTTSNGSDTLITGFSVTPFAGRYAVWFSTDLIIESNNKIAECTQYYGGIANANTVRDLQGTGSNYRGSINSIGEATVNGSQAVDVRVKVTGGSVTIGQRSMFLIRLGT